MKGTKPLFRLENGYESQTTFLTDFMIAERFGINAVKDTFKRAFNEWKKNVVYLTELAIVTNLLAWRSYEKDMSLCKEYSSMYDAVNDYAVNNLTNDEYGYFFQWTD